MPPGRDLQPARLIGLIWGGMGSADTLNAPRAILERMMPDAANTLIFTLDRGDVNIRLRPALAPCHLSRSNEQTLDDLSPCVSLLPVLTSCNAAGCNPHGAASPEPA